MICQICKKNEATVIIIKDMESNRKELYVCSHCAHHLLGSAVSSFSFSQYNINEILENLLNPVGKYGQGKNITGLNERLKCSDCGMDYQEFTQSGKLGCRHCYEYFRERLKPLLDNLHGHSKHTGKVPLNIKEKCNRMKRIKEIKDEMEESIRKEEYEKAAELRDMIIKEEKRLKKVNNE